jgi:hypothetical protein
MVLTAFVKRHNLVPRCVAVRSAGKACFAAIGESISSWKREIDISREHKSFSDFAKCDSFRRFVQRLRNRERKRG